MSSTRLRDAEQTLSSATITPSRVPISHISPERSDQASLPQNTLYSRRTERDGTPAENETANFTFSGNRPGLLVSGLHNDKATASAQNNTSEGRMASSVSRIIKAS